MTADLRPPVVILGMHRSGTSILARMLGDCGLFLGKVDGHFESPFFRDINDGFLVRAGSYWADIDGYLRRRSEPAFRRECREWAETRVRDSFALEFLGPRTVPTTWGWKDPRNCLAMNVWNEIFPEARLVHIVRHPLDVALSIQRREAQLRERGEKPLPQNADLAHNLRLWEQHVADALRFRAAGDRYHEVRFEELIALPRRHLDTAARFCGLAPIPAKIEAAAAPLDGSRTRRFEDGDYAGWQERIAAMPLARDLGYG